VYDDDRRVCGEMMEMVERGKFVCLYVCVVGWLVYLLVTLVEAGSYVIECGERKRV